MIMYTTERFYQRSSTIGRRWTNTINNGHDYALQSTIILCRPICGQWRSIITGVSVGDLRSSDTRKDWLRLFVLQGIVFNYVFTFLLLIHDAVIASLQQMAMNFPVTIFRISESESSLIRHGNITNALQCVVSKKTDIKYKKSTLLTILT